MDAPRLLLALLLGCGVAACDIQETDPDVGDDAGPDVPDDPVDDPLDDPVSDVTDDGVDDSIDDVFDDVFDGVDDDAFDDVVDDPADDAGDAADGSGDTADDTGGAFTPVPGTWLTVDTLDGPENAEPLAPEVNDLLGLDYGLIVVGSGGTRVVDVADGEVWVDREGATGYGAVVTPPGEGESWTVVSYGENSAFAVGFDEEGFFQFGRNPINPFHSENVTDIRRASAGGIPSLLVAANAFVYVLQRDEFGSWSSNDSLSAITSRALSSLAPTGDIDDGWLVVQDGEPGSLIRLVEGVSSDIGPLGDGPRLGDCHDWGPGADPRATCTVPTYGSRQIEIIDIAPDGTPTIQTPADVGYSCVRVTAAEFPGAGPVWLTADQDGDRVYACEAQPTSLGTCVELPGPDDCEGPAHPFFDPRGEGTPLVGWTCNESATAVVLAVPDDLFAD